MPHDGGGSLEMSIQQFVVEPAREGYSPVTLVTSRGEIACRSYAAEGARRGAIWVPGAIGGWHTPADGLYAKLCEELAGQGIASLWVHYREPGRLDECILDVLAGLIYLESAGVERAALTGHSFGGAVVVQAAAIAANVRTVVTLATQAYGADVVSELAPRCSILLLHGTDDHILPVASSEYVHGIAGEPKRLLVYEGADHNLDEVADEVHRVVRDWIVGELDDVDVSMPA